MESGGAPFTLPPDCDDARKGNGWNAFGLPNSSKAASVAEDAPKDLENGASGAKHVYKAEDVFEALKESETSCKQLEKRLKKAAYKTNFLHHTFSLNKA